MEYKVYSIFDSKIEAFLQPFCAQTKGQAIRMFTDSVNDPQTMFSKHPEDYVLFELGSWFDDSGRYAVHTAPVSIGIAIEFKRS